MKRLFLVAVERKEPWLRILMINQVFYPDVAATAQHAHDLSRSLVASGHEVSIIASGESKTWFASGYRVAVEEIAIAA